MKQDANDTLRKEGPESVRGRHDRAHKKNSKNSGNEPAAPEEPAPADLPSNDDAEITRLAKLKAFDYERERKAAAEKLSVRASILDRLVDAERDKLGLGDGDGGLQGSAVTFEEIEPWPTQVDGAQLLDALAKTIRSHVVMADYERDICSLWIMHTYIFKHFKISPKLSIKSVVKQCGKTTLLEVLSYLVYRAWTTGSITAAALFRVIEMYHPTLLIDEVDTFVGDNEELRGMLNHSHRYDGYVTRTVGDNHEPRRFSVYAPVALSGIGGLADTLADRSVTTVLKRRRVNEPITQLRIGRMEHLHELQRRITRWIADHEEGLAQRDPEMPASIINRDADNLQVLLAIADEAGGGWPKRARMAAEAHQIAVVGDDASRLEVLLGDVRDVFNGLVSDKDRISSAHLIERLVEIVPRPWSEYGRTGKPLSQNGLARLLKPLGITSQQIRFTSGDNCKGYYRKQFEEAWERFLPPEGASQPKQRNKCDEMGTSEPSASETAENAVSDGKSQKSNNDGLCYGVTDGKGGPGEKSASRPDLAIQNSNGEWVDLKPLAVVLDAWRGAIGIDQKRSLDHILEVASEQLNLRAALLTVASMDDAAETISNVKLARFLRSFNEVVVGGLMLSGGGVDGNGSPWWTLVSGPEPLDGHSEPIAPGLSPRRVSELASWGRDLAERLRDGADLDQKKLADELRRVLREEVLPEHVEVELDRVMAELFKR
jgi:putative DNA primase/helicase